MYSENLKELPAPILRELDESLESHDFSFDSTVRNRIESAAAGKEQGTLRVRSL